MANRADAQLPAQQRKSFVAKHAAKSEELVLMGKMLFFVGPLLGFGHCWWVAFAMARLNAPEVFGKLFRSAEGSLAQTERSRGVLQVLDIDSLKLPSDISAPELLSACQQQQVRWWCPGTARLTLTSQTTSSLDQNNVTLTSNFSVRHKQVDLKSHQTDTQQLV